VSGASISPMSEVGDLAAWLTAIWDEDERERLEELERGSRIRIVAHPNEVTGQRVALCDDCNDWASEGSQSEVETAGTQHVREKHDYERVLARIAADRAILAECSIVLENKDPKRLGERILAWAVVRQLASVHRDRPNWREAWQ